MFAFLDYFKTFKIFVNFSADFPFPRLSYNYLVPSIKFRLLVPLVIAVLKTRYKVYTISNQLIKWDFLKKSTNIFS